MKISRVGGKTNLNESKRSDKTQKPGNFALSLDIADKGQAEQQLQEKLNEIDKLGKRLISTRSVEDAREYKRKIQEYLSYIIKNIYRLKREPGAFNYGIHVRIEVINKHLDELTKQLIDEQKDTIEFADRIEEIKGLLVDVYK
jgi:uncharacterized protein